MRLTALVVAFALTAGGCGQKGQLYLRDNPPPGTKTEKRDTYKPIPYPPDSADESR